MFEELPDQPVFRFTRRATGSKFLPMNTLTESESAPQESLEQSVPSESTDAAAISTPEVTMAADDPAPASSVEAQADGAVLDEPITTEHMPLRQVLEALLFASDVPLSAAKITQTLGLDSLRAVKLAVEELNEIYNQREAAFRIEERAGGYQILTLPQYAQYIQRLMRKRDEGRLTPAALETLAIIAYKQPILRVDVEAIRGVACGEVIRTLMEYNLVKIVGRAEDVGRPMLYGTSKHFLEVFGLASLKDLPKADQLKQPV
jgi:segregation and condensation protein B